jgi:Helix-hairpin-helix containing domain
VQVMTENPYRLARDIRGIGFKSADAIAMKLGIEKTAMIRLRAGISYALTEAMDEGHCGLPTDQLIPLAEELLEAPRELILTALELERSEGAVIADKVGDTVGGGRVFGCGHNVRLSRALLASRDIGLEKKPGLKSGLVRVCPGFIVRAFWAGRSFPRNRIPGAPESASCGE